MDALSEDLPTQLKEIVGAERVSVDSASLEAYSKDHSFVLPRMPLAVVYPETSDEVKALVKWANESRTPLVPVSSGPTHFRGDTIPNQGGVVVDLSRMKRILNMDERNRAVRVEPGVTYGQLVPELEKHGLRLPIPLLPRASKSVLASVLEREPGTIPKYMWDTSDPLLTLEIVFGTGDTFRTGSASGIGEPGEGPRALINPLGPSQVDLFRVIQGAQGTLGIVTWANLRTEVLPTVQKIFLIQSQTIEKLIEFTYRLLRVRLGDECLLLNNLNLASILAETWPEEFNKMWAELPPWTLVFTLAGYRILPKERVEYQEMDMTDIAEELGVKPLTAIPGFPRKETRMLEMLRKPWPEESHWKLRHKGGCQDLFFLTTLDRTSEFIQSIGALAADREYPTGDIGCYIQPITQGRACHCEFNLHYDPSDAENVDATQRFFIEASELLSGLGAFYSRPYGPWADIAYSVNPDAVIALRKLKKIFDPNGVMNPGKLCF